MPRIGLAVLAALLLSHGGDLPAADLSAAAVIGKKLFFDPTLSASGRLSCAGCHDPRYAYAAPNGLDVQLGGADLRQPGTRSVPSLRYTLRRTPLWSKEFQADPLERILDVDSVPAGGFDWDGRFNSIDKQAASPVLASNEMANASPAAFVARIAASPYAGDFRRVFGAAVFAEPGRAFAMAMHALERFELEDSSFYSYTSKFDDFLDGKVDLSPREKRGLVLFSSPGKGNCASCHSAALGADGSHPLFTDFGFQALGVPRNPRLAANADPGYFDMGLCGPQRTDQANRPRYCGMFKTPSLRNVAARRVFFHNGRFHSLREVLQFYATRDQDARRWYPQRAGAGRYDDLPPSMQRNVDHIDGPFNRADTDPPALSDAEIEDLLAFLETLTDRDVAAPPE